MRFLAFLFILGMASCSPDPEVMVEDSGPDLSALDTSKYNVAFLIMDGVYNTEFTAPFDIFHHTIFRDSIKPMRVFTVANTLEAITSFEGLRILPDFDYTQTDLPIDILVVPSAEGHLDKALEDTVMLNFVKSVAEDALFVASHCDGAFVLAEAGLLEGMGATTFPADIELMREKYPNIMVEDSVLFVHDTQMNYNIITSVGGAKSFEASLYLCEVLYGKKVAREIAEGLVLDWNLDSIPYK